MRRTLDIDPDILRDALTYDAETGAFIRRSNGRPAGYVRTNSAGMSYIVVKIKATAYAAHRLAWAYSNGPIPAGMIVDHANRNSLDNRLGNLRLASDVENSRNKKTNPRSRSGLKGAMLQKGRYRARIVVDGKNLSLGMFGTAEEAHAAYEAAAIKHFGEFACMGES